MMMLLLGIMVANALIAIVLEGVGKVTPLTIQAIQIAFPATPVMRLQITTVGSVHNVIQPVIGQAEVLTIADKLIATLAI